MLSSNSDLDPRDVSSTLPPHETTKLPIDIVTNVLETKLSQMDTTDLAEMKKENTHTRIGQKKTKENKVTVKEKNYIDT